MTAIWVVEPFQHGVNYFGPYLMKSEDVRELRENLEEFQKKNKEKEMTKNPKNEELDFHKAFSRIYPDGFSQEVE